MAETPREMAAVMFTDVRGYSALTQRDEALALRLLEVKRNLAEPLIAEYQGRLVKTIGDALMVEFKSALAAAQCAVDLQKKLHEHNQSVSDAERLVVRIGVHLGDVVRKDGDLLGDTVNIAARVEPEAPPGGIALTQTVYEQIRGKLDYPLLPLGGHKLKGIEGEVALYAVKLPWQSDIPVAGPRPGFVARLKQHHMFRVASVYATVAYVLILVANAVFPDIGLTREDVRYLIAGLALGFPIVLTSAWMLVPPSRENPEQFSRWRRVRWRLGAVFSLIVIGFVTISGIYLWRLNTRFVSASSGETSTASVVALPFDRLGAVDASVMDGLQGTLEATLAGLGSVRVISHSALGTPAGGPALAAARGAGARYLIQGSVQRDGPNGDYTVRASLVSVSDAAPIFSFTDTYAAGAPPVALEQQVASRLAGPLRFVSRPDDWLAKGFPTTSDARALELLREALMADYYGGDASPVTLLREAVDRDPHFAQAHAYLAYFMVEADSSAPSRAMAEDELARAQHLAPGLPEVELAQGAIAWLMQDDATALRELAAVENTLPANFLLHFTYGRELQFQARDDDTLKEILAAAAIDPYQPLTTDYAARIYFFRRDYESSDALLVQDQATWPLNPWNRLYRAMVAFAARGDLPALARVVDGDWSAFKLNGDWLAARQIEVAHLEGRHAEVLKLLAAYPKVTLENTRFFNIIGRIEYRDALEVQSLRLLGRDAEAKRQAVLALPQAEAALAETRVARDNASLRVAEIQAFGGDPDAALKSISPLTVRLSGSESAWGPGDTYNIVAIAVVLAWSGKQADAVAYLSKALARPCDVHAAVLARDPVWRPLYREPAFKALLAKYGQTLAYAK